jgi:hypothetical protein
MPTAFLGHLFKGWVYNAIGLVIGSCQNALGAILSSSNVILVFVGFAYQGKAY